jgi:UDP-N-acetylmuramate--alanine ligase
MNYYLLGIKGAAMANIAVMLKQQGHSVNGVDVAEVFPTDTVLLANDIKFEVFPVPSVPPSTDIIVYSAAHGGLNHPLVQDAQTKKKKILHQAELLGELLTHFRHSIAVAGCHGKTTTSSLLSYALIQLGQKPSYMVGTPSFSGHPGSAFADNKYFVIEADEYGLNPPDNAKPKFHFLKPNYGIILNIDFDHPDVFKDLNETKAAFKIFMEDIVGKNSQAPLVLCADDAPLMDVAKAFNRAEYSTFGLSADADFQVSNISYHENVTQFELHTKEKNLGLFSTKLAGEKNATNTAGVIALLLKLGFTPGEIQTAIADFSGAKRRFELIGEKNGIKIYDDYAHHPHELEAVIEGTKHRFPGKRLIVIFQPHTFTRTEMLQNEFIEALAKADGSILVPIFASARENVSNTTITSSDLASLAEKQGYTHIFATESTEETLELLKDTVKSGDIILLAGAGDVYKLKDEIMNAV